MSDVMDCISKLLKILLNTKHNKIRFNSICAIKNIMFYSNQNQTREIKKSIMKKFTYEYLLTLLDDEDISIQEQALLIVRFLLFKTSDDIEEVFHNCKTKLLKKLEEKLNDQNPDIILQSLYVLLNISVGNEKQKNTIQDKTFLRKISEYLVYKYILIYRSLTILK